MLEHIRYFFSAGRIPSAPQGMDGVGWVKFADSDAGSIIELYVAVCAARSIGYMPPDTWYNVQRVTGSCSSCQAESFSPSSLAEKPWYCATVPLLTYAELDNAIYSAPPLLSSVAATSVDYTRYRMSQQKQPILRMYFTIPPPCEEQGT